VLAHGPGLLPAGLTGKRQGGERGHMGPWPQPRGQGPLWDFFLKEAARRHDSSLLKFRTPTEIQVPLLAAASMARISSYADIRGFLVLEHFFRSVKPYCTASLASHGALTCSLKR
jgi:hypothetical protein